MNREFSKKIAVLLLVLPFLAFGMVVIFVSVRHAKEMAVMLSVPFDPIQAPDVRIIVAAFLVALIIELKVFFSAINFYASKSRSLETIGRKQERSAQLLVRRDLELTRAVEQLRGLEAVKSGFISVVAHQLRTPLSGIKWTLNLLINGDMGALRTEQKTFLLKAYESNDRMISLVNDLLSADRIESGKVRFVFQPIQLIDVIDNVLFELLPQASAKGLSIQLESRPEGFPKVKADPDQLRAVFQNLLENAVRYSNPSGVIKIGMRVEKQDEALVWIKDDGIGIPRKQQQNIFDRFFRAGNAIKAEVTGSGLGLFIVKNIIERHHGRIWFESEEGKGSTFFFTLPTDKTNLS